MIELKGIKKNYYTGGEKVEALKGVDVTFRDNEFVSILGHSGCGKTTLLNIIGGLDRFSKGDMIINGKSTKKFTDRDWDTYRNHSIGFVFQSYNLIPHQTVLANVELALTISGVSKTERRTRAIEALNKVGLGDQLKKKPNQMSGGQVQRVAIARSLVNDPDILLADEPTGALDSETSVQIMEILKEISKDRLIIMVTHNPELAEKYSSRIVKLKDGVITDDSNPYTVSEDSTVQKPKNEQRVKKASMSFLTELSLSFNNLRTKKARTILTAFAGSIGIIGIALILSLSTGVKNYINTMEEEALANYPITINSDSMDIMSIISSVMNISAQQTAPTDKTDEQAQQRDPDKIYTNTVTLDIINSLVSQMAENDLKSFKSYLDSNSQIKEFASSISYDYDVNLQVYSNSSPTPTKVNPNPLLDKIGVSSLANSNNAMNVDYNVFQQIPSDRNMLENDYKLLYGKWPENRNQVVLVLDGNGEISDYTLYSLGYKDVKEFEDLISNAAMGKEIETKSKIEAYSYDEFIGQKFKVLPNSKKYAKSGGVWIDKSSDNAYMNKQISNGVDIEVVGIIKADSPLTKSANMVSGYIGYTTDLADYIIELNNASAIAKEQKANPKKNVFTGTGFTSSTSSNVIIKAFTSVGLNAADTSSGSDLSSLMNSGSLANMSDKDIGALINRFLNSDATYEGNLSDFGCANLDVPSSINIYPKDFESKGEIQDIINKYNEKMVQDGNPDLVISYTDMVGVMMESIVNIVDIISYVLIGFVAVSLIVSSIMIAIITYISVIERTKEIGILRSIGASKRNISGVFNAETILVGLCSGLIGVGITLLLNIPINIIANKYLQVDSIAHLGAAGAIFMILLSVFLTFIAGLIPSSMAAKKNPVEALRTE